VVERYTERQWGDDNYVQRQVARRIPTNNFSRKGKKIFCSLDIRTFAEVLLHAREKKGANLELF
jgi:hypothetical protein